MYKRYLEIKNLFKEHAIIFKNKDRYISFFEDKEIINMIKYRKFFDLKDYDIDYLVLDNLEIIEKYESDNNRYHILSNKCKIINVIKRRIGI